MGEQEPWAFASPTGTREQCAFKTSRRAIVSPSLPLIVACFQPCFPVTFAGCEREQRCARPARCRPEEGAVPAGDGAAPGPAQPRARSGNPACLSLVTLPHPSCSSGVPLLLARPAVASSCRSDPPATPAQPTLRELRAGARGSAVGDAVGSVCCLPGDAVGCPGIAWLPEHKVTATNTRSGLLLGKMPCVSPLIPHRRTLGVASFLLPRGGQRHRGLQRVKSICFYAKCLSRK